MLTMPSFKKSLIVEQFQGNYLKTKIDKIDTLIKTKNDKIDTLFQTKTPKNIPWLAARPH